MADTILQYLAWAIPSGGIGAAIAWIANRRMRRMHEVKEVHDTYKEMYHDISQEIKELRRDNVEILENSERIASESRVLKRSLDRLSRAIEAIRFCDYHDNCPVRAELQDCADVNNVGKNGTEGVRNRSGQSERGSRRKKGKPCSSTTVGSNP